MSSDHTTAGYASDWRAFIAFVKPRVPGEDPTNASPRAVAAFVRWARGPGGYARSSARRMAYGVLAKLREAFPDRWPRGVVPPEVKAALARAPEVPA